MLTIAARPPAENASRIVAEDGGLGLIGVLPILSPILVCSLSPLGCKPDQECLTKLIICSKSAFGIKVNPKMIVVPGRVLSSPKVTYSGKAKADIRRGGASWNMRGLTFLRAATIPPWAMLRIGAAARISPESLEKQCKSLTGSFRLCGLKSEEAKFRPSSGPLIPDLKRPNDPSEMDKSFVTSEICSTYGRCKANGISMLLVILLSNDSWLYDRIKYWGDVKYGNPP